ncbi:MAG: PAS domain S-box protein [Candidatus Omnitrophica bacterium]|nr:PAS domain S-box protein [Candidatus Omnitrophota bacterium]
MGKVLKVPGGERLGIFGAIFIFAAGLVIGVAAYLFFPENIATKDAHLAIELMGSFTALSIGLYLVLLSGGRNDHYFIWLACGFLSMGSLRLFHPFAGDENLFLWFYSVSNLAGSLLFSLVWLPERLSRSKYVRKLPGAVVAASLMLGVGLFSFPAKVPLMIEAGEFTCTADIMNILSGVFFFAASIRLFALYRSYKAQDGMLFSFLAFIFGITGLLSNLSFIGSFNWWLSHMIWLCGFLVILSYIFLSLRREYIKLCDETIESRKTSDETARLQKQIGLILSATKTNIDIIDFDYNLIYVDDGWRETYGDYRGRKCYEYFAGRNSVCPGCALTKVFSTKSAIMSEEALPREGGRKVQITSVPFQDETGKWLVAEVNVDISERERAQNAIKESDKKFRELFNHIDSGVAIYEAVDDGDDFVFKDFNPAAERIERVNAKDVIGKRVTEVFPGVKKFGIFEVFQRVWRTGKAEYFPIKIYRDERTLGSWRENWVYKLPSGEIVATYNDITERKKMEEELHTNEVLLEATGRMAQIGGWEIDLESHRVTWSKEACRLHGVEPGYSPRLDEAVGLYAPGSIPALKEALYKLEKHGEPFDLELEFFPVKSTKKIWVRVMGEAVRYDGKIVKLRGTFQNIDERKSAEEKLHESEEHYRILTENITDFVWMADLGLRFTYVSPSVRRQLGYEPEELMGQTIATLITPESFKVALKLFEEEMAVEASGSGDPSRVRKLEVEQRHKDGSLTLGDAGMSFLRDMNKRPIGIIGVTRDITERKRMEKILVEEQAKLRALFDNIFQLNGFVTTDGILTGANKAALKFGGVEASEVINKPFWETPWFSHSKVLQEKLRKAISEANEGKTVSFEGDCPTKNGEIRYFDFSIKPVRDENGKILFLLPEGQDVTERKRVEKLLEEGRDRLVKITDAVPGTVYEFKLTPTGKMEFTFLSRGVEDLFEVSPEELLTDFSVGWNMILPEDTEPLRKSILESAKNRSLWRNEFRIKTASGATKYVLGESSPVLTDEKGCFFWNGTFMDVTWRKKAEEAVKEGERKVRAVFDQTFQFMGLMTPDGILIEVNRAAMAFAGIEEKNVLNKPFWEAPWWTHSPELQEKLKKAIKSVAQGEFVRFEATHVAKDGSLRYIDFSLKPVKDESGKVIYMIPEGRDITENKLVQLQLAQASKLSGVGQLSSGLAHELNSPLMGMINLLESYMKKIKPTSREEEELKEMMLAAQHMSSIVKSLSTFSRKSTGVMASIDLNKTIENVLTFGKYHLEHNGIEIVKHYSPDLAKIKGEDAQLQQIVLDMITNSRDAMPKGGKFTITTRNSKDGKVIMEFSDTGTGIKKEHLSVLFDPFFTTKEPGKGTGLGLSVVHGIVKNHGGKIYVTSEEGKGATFTIEFPAA